MRDMQKIMMLFLPIFLLCGMQLQAQTPEGIITESGEQKDLPTEEKSDAELPDESIFVDDIVERTLMQENRLLEYPFLREADIPWSKKVWRKVDTRQKINQHFSYIPLPLAQIFFDGLEEGAMTAFTDDDFKTVVPFDDIMDGLDLVDTTEVPDLDDPTKITYKVTVDEFDPASIQMYRVKEVWYFDEEASRMNVRTLGISPVREVYNKDTGEYMRSEPMFWIYFPEAREYLSRIPTFNDFNDSAPMTWADVFDARKFNSFIYKITNVTDDRLDLMYSDNKREMLFEGERIHEELFNMEQDLWSY